MIFYMNKDEPMENCLKCGKPLESSTGKGRPNTYCSTACRRTAEFEIRRINLRLIKLEEQASNARLGYGMPSEGHIRKLKDEIALYEERLRVLLEVLEPQGAS